MSLLSVGGLTKLFGDRILFENAVFAVEKGDKIGFIGANGVGKTTLFKIIIGNEPSTRGEAVPLFQKSQKSVILNSTPAVMKILPHWKRL